MRYWEANIPFLATPLLSPYETNLDEYIRSCMQIGKFTTLIGAEPGFCEGGGGEFKKNHINSNKIGDPMIQLGSHWLCTFGVPPGSATSFGTSSVNANTTFDKRLPMDLTLSIQINITEKQEVIWYFSINRTMVGSMRFHYNCTVMLIISVSCWLCFFFNLLLIPLFYPMFNYSLSFLFLHDMSLSRFCHP